jgi:glycosyltransferase involved in cell wall biosynthesis
MRTRICYVYSDVDNSHLIESTERFLDKNKYEVSTVFIGEKLPALYNIFKEKKSSVYFLQYSGRKQLPSVIKRLRLIFNEIKPDIVHTHLVNASLAGLMAAKLCGIKRRIHTRHHSTECHVYYPHAVYYDKFINLLSTKIVAISKTVFDVLTEREKVNPQKVQIINHGFDLTKFTADESVVEELKQVYDLKNNYPVIGVISRFVEWKGVQFIIPAFKQLLTNFPKAKLVLAGGTGSYSETILSLLKENLHESQYEIIKFEKRVFELYKTFDVFLHVPINVTHEAFGQTYIEPLALEVPSVFTLSGIANEFIEDKKNALVVPHQNSEAIYNSITLLLENNDLRDKIVKNGKSDVWNRFSAEKMVNALDCLYKTLI